MKRLVAVAATLLLVAACSGELPSTRPSGAVLPTLPGIASQSPGANETASPEETAEPTKTPKQTAQATEEATLEPSGKPTNEPSSQPTEEATVGPSPSETAEASAIASEVPSGSLIEVLAGGGGLPPAQGVAAKDAALQRPTGAAVDSFHGSPVTYVVDGNLGLLLTISQGTIIIVNAGLLGPQGVGIGDDGGGSPIPWVADTANSRVVAPTDAGNLLTIAGSSVGVVGFHGDGGPAKRSLLSQPFDVAGPYIADTTNQRIRYIDPQTGDISTVAGNGTAGYSGDGGPATDAEIANPQAVAITADGTKLYIADYTNFRIREVDLTTGTITTVAGTGDGTAVAYNPKLTGTETPISRASALAIDPQGNVYFPVFWGDEGTTIMRLAPDGTMTKIAGGGTSATADGDPLDFSLPDILGLAINPFDGSLLICGSDGRVYSVSGVATP